MSNTTANMGLLTRSEIWSTELKGHPARRNVRPALCKMLDGFPDGDQFTIPSIGQAQVDNYAEDTAVTYRPLTLVSSHSPSTSICRALHT